MRYEMKWQVFSWTVIISVILNLVMLEVHSCNRFFRNISDIAFLIASLCWLVPMIMVIVKKRRSGLSEKKMIVSTYARSRKRTKWFIRFMAILFILFLVILDLPDCGKKNISIELLDMTRALFMLLVIECGMILNWEQIIYEKGILFINAWLEWQEIEAYACNPQMQLKGEFYNVQLKIKSKRKPMLLPKVRNIVVGTNEKEQLISMLEEKGIERRAYL